ncbi:hypothetical protein DPX39_020027100 [Trypanosoma brucei equiperdum]|uniref:Uncharacterized protein n=1 Tax=Trypanosoma brucei equiperdum TaxID=630700 RepID=A0A3L6LBH0_9TRYP|nr:hypothetical protein DPX39_020027100 [Trypanosoma brucei equiperdum]
MGRQRSLFLLGLLQRQHPEAHKNLTREVERVEREARSDGDLVRLRESCRVVLHLLNEHRELLPFVAQGCPSCLSAVLSQVGKGGITDNAGDADRNDGDESCMEDIDMLRLAALLSTSGSPVDALADGVSKSLEPMTRLVFSTNSEVGELALSLLGRAVRLSADSERLAGSLLGNEKFWVRFARAFFGDSSRANHLDKEARLCTTSSPPSVLASVLGLLRRCCMVSRVGRDASFRSLLVRVCTAVTLKNDARLREEVVLLLYTLRITSSTDETECLRECIAVLAPATPGSEDDCANVARNGSDPGFVDRLVGDRNIMYANSLMNALISLQKNQFESSARLRDLERIAKLLFDPHVPCGAAAALVLLPGAVTSVFAAASDVEEKISAFACALFSSAIEGLEEMLSSPMNLGATEQEGALRESDICSYRRCLVEDFLSLGGMVLLEDLLLDYSSGVVSTATRLVRSLMRFSSGTRNLVLASRCFPNLYKALEGVSGESNISESLRCGGEDGVCAMLHIALDTFSLLGSDAAWVLPESAVGCVSMIATESRNNVSVLAAALRTLSVLAASHPMAATVVLDYDYINSVLGMEGDAAVNSDGEEAKEPWVLNDTDAAYICGSFDIMSAVVSQEPSCVTFEWIETLIMATKRAQHWQDEVPRFARPLWNVVVKTVTISEEGRTYLLEDTEFVDVLLNTMASCCSYMTRGCESERIRHSAENVGTDNKVVGTPYGDCSSVVAQLLPLLVRVARFLPALQQSQPLEGACDLVEALAILLSMRGAEASVDLLVNVALFAYDNETTLISVFDLFVKVGLRASQELQQRALASLSVLEGADPAVVEGDMRCAEALGDFERATAALGALLARCRAGEGSDLDNEVVEEVSALILAALKAPSDHPPLLFALPPTGAPPLLSRHRRILSSTVDLLRSGHQIFDHTAQQLWCEHQVFQRVSRFFGAIRDSEGAEELLDEICDLLSIMYGLHNPWASAKDSGVESSDYTPSCDVGDLLVFVVEYILNERLSRSSSCRSLFTRLCECAPFRHGMLAAHREIYHSSLEVVSNCSGEAEEREVFDRWINEKLDGTVHATVA